MAEVSLQEFKSRVEELGGFESIKFSPHMRFRAGQRRLNWEGIKQGLRSGEIDGVELNHNPNHSIPFEEAYIIFLSVDGDKITVPFYILENGTMKAVTVMRE
ncbi:MAG: hypothetical protein ABEK16_02290 [Candidatus Nanohalobium sp.]